MPEPEPRDPEIERALEVFTPTLDSDLVSEEPLDGPEVDSAARAEMEMPEPEEPESLDATEPNPSDSSGAYSTEPNPADSSGADPNPSDSSGVDEPVSEAEISEQLTALDERLRDVETDAEPPPAPEEPIAQPEPAEPADPGWRFSLPSPPADSGPLERPAQALERAQAAILDLGLILVFWLVVVYFASRAARVPMDSLVASWPYLSGYLLCLGLGYGTYFTTATGQTPGKQVLGLRVLGPGDKPPDTWRALARAVLGVLGTLAACLGFVPLLFDPARRALHDRLLGTRVVRR